MRFNQNCEGSTPARSIAEDKKFIDKVNSHFENMQHEMQHAEKEA